MRCFYLVILLFTTAFLSFGQIKPSPTPSPEVRKFGFSLERFEKRKKDNFKQFGKKVNDPDEDVISVKTDLVLNGVLVMDEKANLISGLTKEDFVISEDGFPQKIEVFSTLDNSTIPRDIVLIIDWSSASGPYLKDSFNAAHDLIDRLGTNDKMAIVTADLKLRRDFTKDKDLLHQVIASLDALDKTDTVQRNSWPFDTLLAVLDEMFGDAHGSPIIIFQGDGIGALVLRQEKGDPFRLSYALREMMARHSTYEKSTRKFGFNEIRKSIERSRATIYSIIPGPRFYGLSEKEQLARANTTLKDVNTFYKQYDERYLPAVQREYQSMIAEMRTVGQIAMIKIAELSGGNTGFVEKPEDAREIYSEIFSIINNRYVIGYYPPNQSRSEKPRTVKVEVRGHPEYKVTGRTSYLVPD